MAGAVAVAFGLLVQPFDINLLVGWAFAIAASSFCPLLVLGIWWRGLTAAGAGAGIAVGGGLASAAILVTMIGQPGPGWAEALLGQPAAWTVPAAFLTMVVVSRLTARACRPRSGPRWWPCTPPRPWGWVGTTATDAAVGLAPTEALMGLMQRFSMIFKAKATKALDRMEDPRETLDYSYQRQMEMLQKVKRGLLDVATSRKRLELQGEQLQAKAAKLHDQAKRAMAAGREDLAREALSRRAAIEPEMEALKTQHAQLQAEEAKLTEASKRLSAQVEAFRTRKETIKATYTAAEAQTKIGEALSGISEEMGDVGLAVQRAEDKTLAMQARAGRHRRAPRFGCARRPLHRQRLEAELGRAVASSEVELELARLKAELPAAEPPKPLEAGES